MKKYYVNNKAQSNGDHEVHIPDCKHFPSDKTYLGEHSKCQSAVTEAKKIHVKSNGCYYCCRECHTS